MTLVDLHFVLLAGADSLDWHNPCAQCGTNAGTPCIDGVGNQKAYNCSDRVPGDFMQARMLRRMANATAHRYHMLTGQRI